jgi:hypothetical protein
MHLLEHIATYHGRINVAEPQSGGSSRTRCPVKTGWFRNTSVLSTTICGQATSAMR